MNTHKAKSRDYFKLSARIAVASFLVLCLYLFVKLVFIKNNLSDYLFSENLLHYTGGYMRRSLLGSFLLLFGDNNQKMVVILLYSSMFFLMTWYALKESKNIFVLLIFLLNPLGTRMYLFDTEIFYRKEFLFIMPVISAILLYRMKSVENFTHIFIWVTSVLMIMIHESFIFLAAPVIGWVMHMNKVKNKIIIAYSLLMILAFTFLTRPPSEVQIKALDDFFASRSIDWSLCKKFFIMSKQETLAFSIQHFMKGSIIFFTIHFIIITSFMLYNKMLNRNLLNLFWIQISFCFLLSLAGIDYGRWMGFLLTSLFLCFFAYGDQENATKLITSSTPRKLIYVLFIIYLCSFQLPHFIENFNLSENISENLTWRKIHFSVLKRVTGQHD